MQYNIKVTVTKGVKEPGNPVENLKKFLFNNDFPNEPTVKEIKDYVKSNQIDNYDDSEINGAVLMVGGKPATDDNEKVPQRAFINYVLNLK